MIDLEKMSKQHAKLFPHATAESQFVKMEEEIQEFYSAQTHEQAIKELADIWIVCAGLYRFYPKTANSILDCYSGVYIDEEYGRTPIETEVKRKWQVNLGRKWEWNGKTYKHVGKDGNE